MLLGAEVVHSDKKTNAKIRFVYPGCLPYTLGCDSHSGYRLQYVEEREKLVGYGGVLSWIPCWKIPMSRLIPADSSK